MEESLLQKVQKYNLLCGEGEPGEARQYLLENDDLRAYHRRVALSHKHAMIEVREALPNMTFGQYVKHLRDRMSNLDDRIY